MRALESGAGWSGEPDDELPDEPPRLVRYRWDDVLGEGGMGTVHAAFDRRLGREVALKRARPGRGDASARLAWEAWITARLDHPGIVPVYDASTRGEGPQFFTMRLVRGVAFREALSLRRTIAERLGLLRGFLTVCEAVAHAHGRGVVHRDLKPANIMIGELGEVQVVDWGLAGLLVRPEDEPAEGVPPEPPRGHGTDGYAAPEQWAGAPPDPRADVYSLGVMLGDLLDAPGPVPAALDAVARRARDPEPERRYASALELAAEVERFLEGRRVHAHDEPSLEAIHRLARRHRAALLAIAAGVLAAALAFGLSYRDVREGRRRAVEAEQRTRTSLREAERALAQALEGRASTASAIGAMAEAEIFAAEALRHGESSEARGVLAAAHGGGRVRAARFDAPEGCASVVFDVEGYVCLMDREVVYVPRDGGEARWRVPFVAEDAAFAREHVVLRGPDRASVRDLADGAEVASLRGQFAPRGLLVSPDGAHLGAGFRTTMKLRLAGGAARELAPCPDRTVHAMALGARHVAFACAPGELRVVSLVGGPTRVVAIPFGADRLPAFALAFGPEDETLLLGNLAGELLAVPLRERADGAPTDALRPWSVAERPIARVAFLDRDRAVIQPEGGVARVCSLSLRAELLRLPVSATDRVDVRGGGLLTAAGRSRWRWELESARAPSTLRVGAGLSGAAFAPDGAWVALARGDGVVSVRSLADGAPIADVRVADVVVKRVAVGDASRRLWVALAGDDGAVALDTRTWRVVSRSSQGRALRRVGVLRGPDGERVVGASYGPGLDLGEPTGAPRVLDAPQTIDLAIDPDGRGATLLAPDGEVRRLVPPDRLSLVGTYPFARAVAGDGVRLAIAFADHVRLERSEGALALPADGGLEDVVLSEDGRWVAAGAHDGTATVWSTSDGVLRARLRGPRGRVAWLGFAPDGRLATASWDGALRLYDLAQLDRPREALAADARRAWRLAVDELRAPGR